MDMEKELEQLVRSRKMGKCKKCGGVFRTNRMGRYECDNCGNVELDDEGKVREYLEKYGASTYAEVEAGTGVSRKVLDRFLLPGRR